MDLLERPPRAERLQATSCQSVCAGEVSSGSLLRRGWPEGEQVHTLAVLLQDTLVPGTSQELCWLLQKPRWHSGVAGGHLWSGRLALGPPRHARPWAQDRSHLSGKSAPRTLRSVAASSRVLEFRKQPSSQPSPLWCFASTLHPAGCTRLDVGAGLLSAHRASPPPPSDRRDRSSHCPRGVWTVTKANTLVTFIHRASRPGGPGGRKLSPQFWEVFWVASLMTSFPLVFWNSDYAGLADYAGLGVWQPSWLLSIPHPSFFSLGNTAPISKFCSHTFHF